MYKPGVYKPGVYINLDNINLEYVWGGGGFIENVGLERSGL